MSSNWSRYGFEGLVYVVSLLIPMLIHNSFFVPVHPAPHLLSIS